MAEKYTIEQRLIGMGLKPTAEDDMRGDKEYFIIEQGRFVRFFEMLDKPAEPREVHYAAVFLDDASKERLLKEHPALLATVYADHVTIVYKPTPETVSGLPLGKSVMIFVERTYTDPALRCQFVGVRHDGPRVGNRAPHITISTDPFTKPSYAAHILEVSETPPGNVWNNGVDLTGTVGLAMSDGTRVFHKDDL